MLTLRRYADHELVIVDLPDWDITDDEAFVAKTAEISPDLIIHCAAMTKLGAEEGAPLKVVNDQRGNSALKKSVLNVLGYRTPSWKSALRDFVAAEF